MRSGADWYKREPLSYLGGVQGMTTREHAVYSITLDLIYQHGGSINNDPAWIAGWIKDMGSAAVRSTITKLIEDGKLCLDGDQIFNKRARNEAKTKQELSENRTKIGRKGGVSSGVSRAISSKNKDLTKPIASPREDKRREDSSSSSARAEKVDEEISDDDLLFEVMAAVGITNGNMPTYWLPPASTVHVGSWRRELGITASQIIEAAKESRKRHDAAPHGPRALDDVMRRLSEAVNAPPLRAIEGGTNTKGQNNEQRPSKEAQRTAAFIAGARGEA